MPFSAPPYVAKLPCNPPDSVPIHEFLFGKVDKYGRFPLASSRSPFTCGISGKTHSAAEVAERIECLARSLASELGLQVNSGNELDKVIAVFSVNAVSPAAAILMRTAMLLTREPHPDRHHDGLVGDASVVWRLRTDQPIILGSRAYSPAQGHQCQSAIYLCALASDCSRIRRSGRYPEEPCVPAGRAGEDPQGSYGTDRS